MTTHYGDSCVDQRKLLDGVGRYEEWWTIVDGERFGPLSTAVRVAFKERTDERIRDNRRISIEDTAFEVSISHGKEKYKNGFRFKSK
jgi:hypothetical protein